MDILILGCELYHFIKPRSCDYITLPVFGMDEEALRGLNPLSDPQLQRRVRNLILHNV